MSHDVFISHSTHDKVVADAICAKLEGIGVRCWIAPRDAAPGSDWRESIVDAIDESRIMVVLLSASANESSQVGRELSTAVDHGLIVIPFRLEDVPLSKRLVWLVGNIHWLDALTPPLEKHLENLGQVVTAILHSGTADPPPPGPGATGYDPECEIPSVGPPTIRRRTLVLLMLGLLVLAAVTFALVRRTKLLNSPPPDAPLSSKYTENRNSFIGALPWLNWILYEPTGYDPYNNREASDANIRKDLQVLRQHGFDGLITTGSHGNLGHIPRIAHEEGFQMVIAGLWEINDQDEVNNALQAAKYADAYCLGHRGLNKRYPITLLAELTKRFRTQTDRPTTTSELVLDYEIEPKLSLLSDFLFPDVHTVWQRGESPEQAWAETVSLAQRAAKLAAASDGKPVLLKMVSYPSAGSQGLTPQKQADFYRLVIEQASDRNDIPARISFSFLGAFDPVWKVEGQGFQKAEQFTGLFSVDRVPKLAITQVKWRKPR